MEIDGHDEGTEFFTGGVLGEDIVMKGVPCGTIGGVLFFVFEDDGGGLEVGARSYVKGEDV